MSKKGYSQVDEEERGKQPTTPISSQPAANATTNDQRNNSSQQEFQYNNRPNGRWADGICDWMKNLYPSCYCSCFCCYGYYLLAQISEKTGFMSFKTLIYIGIALYILCIVPQIIFPRLSILAWATLFFTIIFAISLRWHIVKKDNIDSNFFLECCTGLFCHWCSVAQMARHTYGYTKILDGDGDIDRPDQYVHQPEGTNAV